MFLEMSMKLRMVPFAAVALVATLVSQTAVAGQAGVAVSGRLHDSLSGAGLVGATVVLEELRREAVSGLDGTFAFDDVPPGTYHLSVQFEGFSARRREVTVGSSAVSLDVLVDPDLHFEVVVSVSAAPRSQFETFQPTSVLAGQELAKQLATSLGATLESQPGVAVRSFGPAPARPVIRGLDGDRVLIL